MTHHTNTATPCISHVLWASCLLAMALTACGGGENNSNNTPPATNTGNSSSTESDGTATANCNADNPALTTKGNTWSVTQSTTVAGGETVTDTNEVTTGETVTFNGHPALESRASKMINGQLSVAKNYSAYANGNAEVYGFVAEFNGLSMTSTYTPPISLPTAPQLDKPYTLSWTVHQTAPGMPTIPDLSFNKTVTFKGIESLTVPAGTFQACKSIDSIGGTSWTVAQGKYKNLPLKNISNDGNTISVTTALRLNGA